MDKGVDHEADCLAEYRRKDRTVYEVPEQRTGRAVRRLGGPGRQSFRFGVDVIYQMPFIHDGVRGIADFLVRVEDPEPGFCRYEPVDAKLARSEGKPGHVLQLCFYADALEALTGCSAEVAPPVARLRADGVPGQPTSSGPTGAGCAAAGALVDASGGQETAPEPCPHCDFCEFQETCTAEWRETDSLIYVAGIRRTDRDRLEEAGVETLGLWPRLPDPVPGVRPERLDRLVEQASLQVEARDDPGPTARRSSIIDRPRSDVGPWLRAPARTRRG